MEITKLYHYTSLDAFHKIMTGKLTSLNGKSEKDYILMHATHIRYMNDMMEYLYFQELLWEALEGKGVSRSDFDNYMRKVNLIPAPFVISFSEKQEFLPMWQMYANNATGIMLEFDIKKLKPKNSELSKCSYDEKISDDNYIKDCLTSIKCNSILNAIFDPRGLREKKAYFKSPDYKHEGEWRIYKQSELVYTKMSGAMIKPYTEVDIPIESLIGVVIGPCMPNREQVKECIDLVVNKKNKNPELEVRFSKIKSYRNNM